MGNPSREDANRGAALVVLSVLCTVGPAWAEEPSIMLQEGRITTSGFPAISPDGGRVAAAYLWSRYDDSGYVLFRMLTPDAKHPRVSFDLRRWSRDDAPPGPRERQRSAKLIRRTRALLKRNRVRQTLVSLGKGRSVALDQRRGLVWPLGRWLTLTYDKQRATLVVEAKAPLRAARWRKRLTSQPLRVVGACCDGGIDLKARCGANPDIQDVYFHPRSRVVLVRYGYLLHAADGCERPGGHRAFRLPRRFATPKPSRRSAPHSPGA